MAQAGYRAALPLIGWGTGAVYARCTLSATLPRAETGLATEPELGRKEGSETEYHARSDVLHRQPAIPHLPLHPRQSHAHSSHPLANSSGTPQQLPPHCSPCIRHPRRGIGYM